MTEFGLMTIFLIIGGIGFLFLLISFIVGDIFEAVGFDFGADLDASNNFGLFDSRVIAMFLTAFGGFGAIAVSFGFNALIRSYLKIIYDALSSSFSWLFVSAEPAKAGTQNA